MPTSLKLWSHATKNVNLIHFEERESTVILSGQAANFLGVLTWDPSLIWNTAFTSQPTEKDIQAISTGHTCPTGVHKVHYLVTWKNCWGHNRSKTQHRTEASRGNLWCPAVQLTNDVTVLTLEPWTQVIFSAFLTDSWAKQRHWHCFDAIQSPRWQLAGIWSFTALHL